MNERPVVDYDCWLKIGGILKANNYSYEVFQKYTELYEKNSKTSVIWDGLKKLKKSNTIYGLQNIAKSINPSLYEEWLVKQQNNVSEASGVILSAVIEDDNEGAEMIYDAIKDRLKFCGGNIFFKQTNIWVNSKQKVDNHLLHFILNKTNLSKMSGGQKPTPKPYSTNVGNAKALREALYAKLIVEGEDNSLIQKFITTTRGKLCFLDGVLDFVYVNPETQAKGKFYTWDNVDFPYYTPV